MAVNSSLLETSIDGARGILLNISGGSDLSLHEVNEVAEIINAAADPEANIIFGAVVDETLGDTIWVTVVATGFEVTSEEPFEEDIDATRLDTSAARAAQPRPGDEGAPSGPVLSREEARAATNDEVVEISGSGLSDEELEVPPFLR